MRSGRVVFNSTCQQPNTGPEKDANQPQCRRLRRVEQVRSLRWDPVCQQRPGAILARPLSKLARAASVICRRFSGELLHSVPSSHRRHNCSSCRQPHAERTRNQFSHHNGESEAPPRPLRAYRSRRPQTRNTTTYCLRDIRNKYPSVSRAGTRSQPSQKVRFCYHCPLAARLSNARGVA